MAEPAGRKVADRGRFWPFWTGSASEKPTPTNCVTDSTIWAMSRPEGTFCAISSSVTALTNASKLTEVDGSAGIVQAPSDQTNRSWARFPRVATSGLQQTRVWSAAGVPVPPA